MKIDFRAQWRHTAEDGARFVAYAKSLGLPYFRDGRGLGPLAVVAGGPSIADQEEELRDFPGVIWGVNGAFEWLHQRGVESFFFSLDPDDDVSHYPANMRGLVGSVCPPAMFDQLKGRNLTLFDVNCPGGIQTGVTSVTATPMLAVRMGYAPITFYGCEGSFSETTHAYPYQPVKYRVVVECNGQRYETHAGFLMQTEVLSELIRKFPSMYREKSGGLLRAMAADPDYDVVEMGEDLVPIPVGDR